MKIISQYFVLFLLTNQSIASFLDNWPIDHGLEEAEIHLLVREMQGKNHFTWNMEAIQKIASQRADARQTNRVLLLGAPAAGKTEVVEQLEKDGHEVAKEAATRAFEEGYERDTPEFFARVLEIDLKDIKNPMDDNITTFFDRGLVDHLIYLLFFGIPINNSITDTLKMFPFGTRVFFFPFCQMTYDKAKPQRNFLESIEIAMKLERLSVIVLKLIGIKIIEVPFNQEAGGVKGVQSGQLLPAKERAAFVKELLKNLDDWHAS